MSLPQIRLIAIDDEPNILISIKNCLNSDIFKIDCFDNSIDALNAMSQQYYDCALIDIRLGKESGIDLFQSMSAMKIDIPTIFMSGNASLNEAANSQKLGAYDFIEKPFSSEKLKITIENCTNYHRLKNKLSEIEKNNNELIGEHQLMVQLKKEIAKVSKTNAVILIQGESGTGKELIASAIHNTSHRVQNSLISVNCSAIPTELVESTLFGHKKGAFTGAHDSKKGFFELADKGTIFLDEIGDMPLSAQTTLLRVLESGEIQKVGAENTINVDVRVIAATHKDLVKEVEIGNFRQDLFYRLCVIPIHSPALRERVSDIPLLTTYLINRLCKRHGLITKNIDDACFQVLTEYDWPGNVRELANILERMVIMGGDVLRPQDIPKDISFSKNSSSNDLSLKEFKNATERNFIINRLNQLDGNVSKVARSLGIDRTNLHKKIKFHGINKAKDHY